MHLSVPSIGLFKFLYVGIVSSFKSPLAPLLYYNSAWTPQLKRCLVTSKCFGALLQTWAMNDSLGYSAPLQQSLKSIRHNKICNKSLSAG